MKMMNSVIVLLLSLIVSTFGQTCGPAQCYSGCTNPDVPLDLVFLIDVSGSMQPIISGVISGVTTFVSNLLSLNVVPWYNVITFGDENNEAVLLLNAETNFGTFKTTIDSLTANGAWEPSLETIRRASNSANAGNFNLNLRSGSTRTIILITNEDSDPAYLNANLYQTDSGNSGHELCPPPVWSQWQAEINATTQAVISQSFSTYLLLAVDTSTTLRTVQTCLTNIQLGDYNLQSQNSDFTNFSPSGTLSNLANAGTETIETDFSNYPSSTIPLKLPYTTSLQAELLEAGQWSRAFNVELTDNPTLIANFFQAIVEDVSKCNDTCYIYPCSTTTPSTCLPPVDICGCNGVPYSGAVLDPYGNCCLPSQTDCSGRCFGSSVLDKCYVCVASAGKLDSNCVQDCSGRYYLNAAPPSGVYYNSTPFLGDVGGYILANSDIYTEFASPTGTLRSIAAVENQFHVSGQFQSRETCTFDATAYALANNVPVASAETDWLNALLANTPLSSKPAASCVPGSHQYLTNSKYDQCGLCVTNTDTPPYCVQDCTGTWRTSASQAYFYDECNACVPPGSNAAANKDSCGVCFGNNTEKNQCGVCFGSTSIDACGNPACENKTCNYNCLGQYQTVLTYGLDPCGICVTPIGSISPQCLLDCNGDYYKNGTTPPFHKDECGDCIQASIVRLPNCVQDCAGVWNGTAYYDKCGQCVSNNKPTYTCTQDCAGNFYLLGLQTPNYTIDSCGVCNTQANQNTEIDKCGVCTNKPGYNSTAECTLDCHGVYNLANSPNRSINDSCGDCWWPNQTQFINYYMDSCGVCYPSRNASGWNSEVTTDSEGNVCPCYTYPHACATQGGGTIMLCVDCPSLNNCSGGGVPDSCGLCPGNSMYGKKDQCGLCCNPEGGIPCNVDVDDCGVCFGFNKEKNLNPCHICNSSLCHVDCRGVANGTAVVGCDGVCDSNATCSYCGNGAIDPGEECDPGNSTSGNGTSSSCAANCKYKSGGISKGSIIGAVIGSVCGAAFLGAAGFFAYKYAEKNGLIGNAGKKLDMGASNSNPLYKGETNIQSNPLYGQ